MKKRSFWAVLVLGLFLLAAFPAYAAEQNHFTLPLTITWGQGGLNREETYQLTLKGTNEMGPMPAGSREEYSLKLSPDESISQLPEITYHEPGDYRYVLELTREDGKNITVYYLHIMAVNGENGEISVSSTLRENDPEGAKTDRIIFVDADQKQSDQPEEPPAPAESTGSSGTTGKVQTGDRNTTVTWSLLLLLSMFLLIILRTYQKKIQNR